MTATHEVSSEKKNPSCNGNVFAVSSLRKACEIMGGWAPAAFLSKHVTSFHSSAS